MGKGSQPNRPVDPNDEAPVEAPVDSNDEVFLGKNDFSSSSFLWRLWIFSFFAKKTWLQDDVEVRAEVLCEERPYQSGVWIPALDPITGCFIARKGDGSTELLEEDRWRPRKEDSDHTTAVRLS